MSDKVQLRIFVQAFTLLAEDALDKIEYFVKTHRQAETLSEIFDGLIKGGHLQEGINQDQLRNLLKDYVIHSINTGKNKPTPHKSLMTST